MAIRSSFLLIACCLAAHAACPFGGGSGGGSGGGGMGGFSRPELVPVTIVKASEAARIASERTQPIIVLEGDGWFTSDPALNDIAAAAPITTGAGYVGYGDHARAHAARRDADAPATLVVQDQHGNRIASLPAANLDRRTAKRVAAEAAGLLTRFAAQVRDEFSRAQKDADAGRVGAALARFESLAALDGYCEASAAAQRRDELYRLAREEAAAAQAFVGSDTDEAGRRMAQLRRRWHGTSALDGVGSTGRN